MCVRFNGGANAGHTVEDRWGTARLHLVPSGALHPGCRGVLGHGIVLDPWALEEELALLRAQGRPEPDLLLSERAHLVLPHHRFREGEAAGRLGTTRRGIGPAYADRAARQGLRLADLADPASVRDHLARMETESADEVAADLALFYARFADRIGDARAAIASALAQGETVVFEGAQGTLLDLDLGTYPYVTSSSTTVHGIGWGTGVRVELERVIGVAKAYTTRVGEGPFPTEEKGDVGRWLREKGGVRGDHRPPPPLRVARPRRPPLRP